MSTFLLWATSISDLSFIIRGEMGRKWGGGAKKNFVTCKGGSMKNKKHQGGSTKLQFNLKGILNQVDGFRGGNISLGRPSRSIPHSHFYIMITPGLWLGPTDLLCMH